MILALSAAGATIPMTKATADSNAGATIIGALIDGTIDTREPPYPVCPTKRLIASRR